jgi:alpha-aminoadipate carrier protein LysW
LTRALYNIAIVQQSSSGRREVLTRCPECDTELDLDEDEVEEGEIVSCPECDAELEVTQTHPVHFIVLSEDEDEDEEEEEGEGEAESEEEDDEEDKDEDEEEDEE